jgi:hypothetical protein
MRSAVSVTDPIEAAGPEAEHVKERDSGTESRNAAKALAEGQRAAGSAIPFNGIARRSQYPRPQYGALMTTYVVLPPE